MPTRTPKQAPTPDDHATDPSWDKSAPTPTVPTPRAVDLERQLLARLNPKRWPSLRQFRHLFKVLNDTEKRVMVLCFSVMVASVTWLGIAEASERFVATPTSGGTYTEAIIGQPRSLNPLYATTSSVDTDLVRLIYAGLFRYDTSLSLTPDLAASYTQDASGKVYTVTMKENLLWHDGEPLTVDDVLFTFESIQQKDIGSTLYPTFAGAVIERLDDRTIRFTLKDPYPLFLNTLTVGILPKHLWEQIPAQQWRLAEYNLRPVGAGPWQFDTISRERDGYVKHVTLSRARTQAGRPEPLLDRITFKFYADETAALEALRSQQAQGLALVSPSGDPQRQAGRAITPYDLTMPAITAVFFNLNHPSALQQVAVRKALSAAVDRNALIVDVLNGRANVAFGPFPTSHTTQPTAEGPEVLLEAAGWKRVGAIRRNSKDEILTVTLSIIDRYPERQVGEYIVERWKAIGVDVKLDLVSPPTPTTIERRLLKPRSYQALLYTIVYGAATDPYPFWHSAERVDPGLNLAMYSNADVDRTIETYRQSPTGEGQAQSLATIEQLIVADHPAIFLYSPLRTYLLNEDVNGVEVDRIATTADRFNGLATWYVRTSRSFQWSRE